MTWNPDSDVAFAIINKIPRTLATANNTPTELTMAPKKCNMKKNSAKENRKQMPRTLTQGYMVLRPAKEKKAEKIEKQQQQIQEQRLTKNSYDEVTPDAICKDDRVGYDRVV